MSERKEIFMRLAVLIVSGIILGIWRWLIVAVGIIHWFYVLFTDKRKKEFADFCEMWNTQIYVFLRYMTFVTNERPFPFTNLENNFSKFKG